MTKLLYLYVVLLFSILMTLLVSPDTADIEVKGNIVYSRAMGYWCESELKENDFFGQFFQLTKTLREKELELTMDIYLPVAADSTTLRPLVMLLHGGAFFANSKASMPVSGLCRTLAENGCVAVSINYRMGFSLCRKSVRKTQKNALEDASDALDYLLDRSDSLGIDRSKVFIGGASSGAITALRLASSRPVAGIIDMWGGVVNPALLDGSDAALIAFHGDLDKTVPYNEGYPLGGKALMEYLYGSKPIVERRLSLGRYARLVTFEGYAHAPYRNKKYEVTENYDIIKKEILEFVKTISCSL